MYCSNARYTIDVGLAGAGVPVHWGPFDLESRNRIHGNGFRRIEPEAAREVASIAEARPVGEPKATLPGERSGLEKPAVARPIVTDLMFQVFDRPVHPELIETLVVRTFARESYRLTLRLTPAGHVIEWRQGAITLVEVLTDQSRPMPENHQLFAHRLGGERNELHAPSKNVSYQTCFQLERLPAELYFHAHNELRHDGQRNGVLHLLHPHDRLGFSPLSYVDLQSRSGSIIVHVFHTYPNDYAIVKSQTLIEMTGGT